MNHCSRLLGLLILLSLACSGWPPAASLQTTSTPTPPAEEKESAPSPSLTTVPTPTSIPAGSPTSLPGIPIQPSNTTGEWLLYDSPNSIRILLSDGQNLWAGSEAGGLVQWDTQSGNPTRHTRATGFPLTTVYDLAFDAVTGYLYAVGEGGLAIWDGNRWQHSPPGQLGFEPDLPLSAVTVEVGTTTIWIGGQQALDYRDPTAEPIQRGGGLLRLDWQSGQWERFLAPQPLISNQINDLLIDAQGTLWVASGHYGSEPTEGGVSFRESGGLWGEYGREHGSDGFGTDRGLDGYAFGQLALGPGGRIYAASRRGVSWLERGAEKWQSVAFWDARQMAIDQQGVLWVAARDGLYRIEESTAVPVVYSEAANYQAVALDGNGDIWYGGPSGLFKLQNSVPEQRPVLAALPALEVTQVAVNGDDTIWLRSGGIVSQLIHEAYIVHYENEHTAIEAAYPWNGEHSLWPVSPEGTIWLLEGRIAWGYDQSGWHRLDLSKEVGEYIQSFTVGPKGLLAFASETGLSLYTPSHGWRTVSWPSWLNSPFLNQIVYDPASESIWGSTSDSFLFPGQLIHLPLDTLTWEALTDRALAETVPPAGISLSPDGELWVVTTKGSIAVQRQGNWEMLDFSSRAPNAMGFARLYFGLQNDLWLTTLDVCGFEAVCINGLAHFDGANWQRFDTANSNLVNGWVYDLAVDRLGNVWVGTAAGLQKIPAP